MLNTSTTNENPADTDGPNGDPLFLYTVSMYVWYCVPPTILLLGNFGNIMTIIVMRRMKSGENIINTYFIALAIMDLVSLDVLLLGGWVGMAFGYFVLYQHDVFCKVYMWTIVFSVIGGWILVCLTVHRAVSVVWPHRVNLLCTRRLVIGLIVGITVFLCLAYSHYLYGFELQYIEEMNDYRCRMKSGEYFTFISKVFISIDTVIYSVLPFTCISLANGVLVWTLRETVRTTGQNLAEKQSAAARKKTASSVTWTVLVVCGAYILLTLPSALDYIFIAHFDPTAIVSTPQQAKTYLASLIMQMLTFCNNAVNFYLYCLTGTKFRGEFVKVFCRARSSRNGLIAN
ncbi:hypothetical protein ACOMHN_004202 [Nucella lapillus]